MSEERILSHHVNMMLADSPDRVKMVDEYIWQEECRGYVFVQATPIQNAYGESYILVVTKYDSAEAKRRQAEAKKVEAAAKKAEVAAQKAMAEAQRAEADAQEAQAAAEKAQAEAKKAGAKAPAKGAAARSGAAT